MMINVAYEIIDIINNLPFGMMAGGKTPKEVPLINKQNRSLKSF